jgi:hypothetical protein
MEAVTKRQKKKGKKNISLKGRGMAKKGRFKKGRYGCLPAAVNTSGRSFDDFWRLLSLQAHCELCYLTACNYVYFLSQNKSYSASNLTCSYNPSLLVSASAPLAGFRIMRHELPLRRIRALHVQNLALEF